MADTTIRVAYVEGMSLSVEIRDLVTGTLLATVAMSGSGNQYTGTVSGAISGTKKFVLLSAGVTVGTRVADIDDTLETFDLDNPPSLTSISELQSILTGASLYQAEWTIGQIRMMRGDDWYFEVSGLGDLSGISELLVTVKKQTTEPDGAALVQWEAGVGLLVLNGSAQSGASQLNGSCEVQSPASGGVIACTLKSSVSRWVTPGNHVFDVQVTESDLVTTLTLGAFVVDADVTRAV